MRRIITGHDEAGRSVFRSADRFVPTVTSPRADWFEAWATYADDTLPIDAAAHTDRDRYSERHQAFPRVGDSYFRVLDFHPQDGPPDVEAQAEAAARLPGLADHTPGKQADIVLIDGTSLSMVGWDRKNVASAIVLHAQPADVDTVWVAGKLAKRHGTMLADASRACGLLLEATERIGKRVEAVGGFHISSEEAQKRMLAVSSTEHGEYDFG